MIEKSFLQYLADLKKFELLSIEQEREFALKARSGDPAAIQALVQGNLRLVVSIAKKFKSSIVPFEDIVQEGNLGLVIAANKYDLSFGIRFASYAYTWIMQYILRYFYSKTSLVRLPVRKTVLFQKIRKACSMYSFLHGRNPSPQELSEFSSFAVDDIRECFDTPLSVCEISEGQVASRSNPEEEAIRLLEKQQAWSLLNILPVKERYIVYHRFNFESDDGVTSLREIGKVLGVSAETVRRLETKALDRMKAFACDLESNTILHTA